MDWSDGSYELTAVALEPVASVVVDAASVARGEKVLDVACGTGNAALAAAGRGAEVVGLDAAERLVEVARERARADGVEAEWVVGDAGELPFPDDAFDVALSTFGVIFAPDAAGAAAELMRVVRPGGRIVVTTWVDRGALAGVMGAARRTVAEVMPDRPEVQHLDWGDPEVLATLFAGATVQTHERHLEFTAASPRAWIEEQEAHHPAWRAIGQALPADRRDALHEEMVGLLEAGDEGSAGSMRVPSPYLVVHVAL